MMADMERLASREMSLRTAEADATRSDVGHTAMKLPVVEWPGCGDTLDAYPQDRSSSTRVKSCVVSRFPCSRKSGTSSTASEI